MKALKRTLRSTKDYGIKIAKKGYDARTASSNQLLYNSSFPMLQIVDVVDDNTMWEIVASGKYQNWYSSTGTTSDVWRHVIKFRHGLGFPPMVVKLDVENTEVFDDTLKWDSQYIYIDKTFYTEEDYNNYKNSPKKVGKMVIFAVDISVDVEYPYFDSAIDTEWGESYDYGCKHLLTTDTATKDPNKLGLNANVQSQLAIAVKVASNDDVDTSFYTPATLGNGNNTMTISLDKLTLYAFNQTFDDMWHLGGPSLQDANGYRKATLDGKEGYTLDGQMWAKQCSLVAVRQPMISSDITYFTTHS